jgi:hypothetical protein
MAAVSLDTGAKFVSVLIQVIGVDPAINNAFTAGTDAPPDGKNPFWNLDSQNQENPLGRAWAAGHALRRAEEDIFRFRARNAARDAAGLDEPLEIETAAEAWENWQANASRAGGQ